jgi:glucose/mannose transport system substrate-binding protein
VINTLVPSIAHLMAQPPHIESAIRDAVATYWNNDRMTADEAMSRMVVAARTKPAAAAKP